MVILFSLLWILSYSSDCFFNKQPLIFGGLLGDTQITDGMIESGYDKYVYVGYTESSDLFGSQPACFLASQSLNGGFDEDTYRAYTGPNLKKFLTVATTFSSNSYYLTIESVGDVYIGGAFSGAQATLGLVKINKQSLAIAKAVKIMDFQSPGINEFAYQDSIQTQRRLSFVLGDYSPIYVRTIGTPNTISILKFDNDLQQTSNQVFQIDCFETGVTFQDERDGIVDKNFIVYGLDSVADPSRKILMQFSVDGSNVISFNKGIILDPAVQVGSDSASDFYLEKEHESKDIGGQDTEFYVGGYHYSVSYVIIAIFKSIPSIQYLDIDYFAHIYQTAPAFTFNNYRVLAAQSINTGSLKSINLLVDSDTVDVQWIKFTYDPVSQTASDPKFKIIYQYQISSKITFGTFHRSQYPKNVLMIGGYTEGDFAQLYEFYVTFETVYSYKQGYVQVQNEGNPYRFCSTYPQVSTFTTSNVVISPDTLLIGFVDLPQPPGGVQTELFTYTLFTDSSQPIAPANSILSYTPSLCPSQIVPEVSGVEPIYELSYLDDPIVIPFTVNGFSNCQNLVVFYDLADHKWFPLIMPAPGFISIDEVNKAFIIAPSNFVDVDSYQIVVTILSADGNHALAEFFIQVTSNPRTEPEIILPPNISPPIIFNTDSLSLNMTLGDDLVFELPIIIDFDNTPVSIEYFLLPVFASLLDNNGIMFQPRDENDIGRHSIKSRLTDSSEIASKSTSYFLNLDVLQVANLNSSDDGPISEQTYTANKVEDPKYLTLTITDIDFYGLVTIKAVPKLQNTNDLLALLTDQTLLIYEVVIDYKSDTNPNLIDSEVQQVTESGFAIQLEFDFPTQVSTRFPHDELSILFIDLPVFMPFSSETVDGVAADCIFTLPPQLQSDFASQALEQSSEVLVSILTFLTIGDILINLFIAQALQLLWSLVNTMQLVTHLPLINFSFPANVSLFYKIIATFASFDFINFEQYLEYVFDFDETESLTYNFEVLSYDGLNLILNLGTVYMMFSLFLVVTLFAAIISPILAKQCKKRHVFMKIKKFLDKNVLYSLLIRLFIESYFELCISCLLNLQQVQFVGSGQLAGSISTFVLSILAITIPPTLLIFYYKNKSAVIDKKVKLRLGSFYDGLRLKSDASMLFIIVFMLRRLILAFSFVYLIDYPTFQWQICMLFSVMQCVYIGFVFPYQSKTINYIEIFNEIMCLLICYFFICMSEVGFDGEVRYDIGWATILIVLITLFVNILIILWMLLKPLLKCRKTNNQSSTVHVLTAADTSYEQVQLNLPQREVRKNINLRIVEEMTKSSIKRQQARYQNQMQFDQSIEELKGEI